MKIPLKKTVAAMTVSAFMLTTTACTTCRQMPIKTADDVRSLAFEPEKTYEVEFTTGQRYNLKGTNLLPQNDLIGVRFQENGNFRYYQHEQFNSICAEEKSKGKTTAAIVGGIVGGLALIAGLVVGISLASWKD